MPIFCQHVRITVLFWLIKLEGITNILLLLPLIPILTSLHSDML